MCYSVGYCCSASYIIKGCCCESKEFQFRGLDALSLNFSPYKYVVNINDFISDLLLYVQFFDVALYDGVFPFEFTVLNCEIDA